MGGMTTEEGEMTTARPDGQRRVWLGAVALLAVAMGAGLARSEPPAGASGGTVAASGMGGMRAYVDPATGVLMSVPPAGVTGGTVPAATSRSGAGLVEVPAPGGGTMVDLQGRFRSTMAASIAPDGGLTASCHTSGGAADTR